MSSVISIEGLASPGGAETRAIVYIDVQYSGNLYKWQLFVPSNVTDLGAYVESCRASIEADIDAKEAQWAALDPKTREYTNPFTEEITIVDIPKSEIVRPDDPDYYARRRAEYPPLSEQLDALWKGSGSLNYVQLEQQIAEIKSRHPKTHKTEEEQRADLIEGIVQATQRRLDNFARTRNYDGILSACTYENSPVLKFQQEGQYCVSVRSQTWAVLYEILDDVEAGTRPLPTSFADIESELPALVWPN